MFNECTPKLVYAKYLQYYNSFKVQNTTMFTFVEVNAICHRSGYISAYERVEQNTPLARANQKQGY